MKSIRFYITERCNAKCKNCFNREERNSSQMEIAKFEELCNLFSTNEYALLKVMGGEPTLHPQFEEMMLIAQSYFPQISLFTNGMSDSLLKFKPREEDNVVYNFNFNHALSAERLLLNQIGRRSLEIQIRKNTNTDRLINDIKRIFNISGGKVYANITLDCVSDIFKEKDIVIPKYEYVWNTCGELGMNVGQDHIAPLCYVRGSKVKIPQSGAMCHIDCAGLIDSSYNIRFCNQYSDVLANIYSVNNSLIDIKTYECLLLEKFKLIQDKISSKGCGSCPMYDVYCNGGCFAGKDYISTCWI